MDAKGDKNQKMKSERQEDVSVLLREERLFTPRKEVTDLAHVQDWDTELAAGEDIEAYWAEKAQIRMVCAVDTDSGHEWSTILQMVCRRQNKHRVHAVDRHVPDRPALQARHPLR